MSAEVLRVQRNQNTGSLLVETAHYGSFIIYVNADSKAVVIPLGVTPTP